MADLELSRKIIQSRRNPFYYSFFTSPSSILEVERTSVALNADDVR